MTALIQQPEELPQQTCFVDGNFADLAQEMANYVQVGDEVSALLQKDEEGEVKNKDEVLKKIVLAIPSLLSAPEKEFTPAYNCLSYLVLQSDNPEMFLPRVCDNLMKPIVSSPVNGTGLALTALSNIFNMLPVKNELRYNVFMAILQFLKHHSMFDNLKGYLPCLRQWFIDWDIDEEDQRKLYIQVAEVAREAGDEKSSYEHVLKALLTFTGEEVKSEEAQQLALRALKVALSDPAHNDFLDILAVPAVQTLADSHPVYYELLMIFAEKDLEDYYDFNEEHEGFIEKEHLDSAALEKKMRLLTFASLAAQTSSREIPYTAIAKALQIPLEDVELWTIDVIRANLVEGRLSQQTKVFKVHRTDYRVFGEKQWREIGDRLDSWKVTIRNIQDILSKGKIEVDEKVKREAEELERRLAQAGLGGPGGGRRGGDNRGDRGDRGDRAPRRERNDDDD
ncbi:hypothetical protein F4818DRAFT_401762 [Hypoxylon cercidicola]|nr:hypothetical protein F4818DRAFT_401762 [Hypoxylon cercidicola]